MVLKGKNFNHFNAFLQNLMLTPGQILSLDEMVKLLHIS